MYRTITVSTEVFAAIWAKRQDGEETEDAILRRVFGCSGDAPSESVVRPPDSISVVGCGVI